MNLYSFIQDSQHLKVFKCLNWDIFDNIIILTDYETKLIINKFYDSFNCIHYNL
jgi:hypothetical protein